MSRQILNGWKEISRHMGRSVRTVQRWESRMDMPVYRPAIEARSALVAFSDELEHWISRASPARGENVVLNDESLSQVLRDMSGLVGNVSGLASQMQLWPEPLQQQTESYHDKSPSRTSTPASVANRGPASRGLCARRKPALQPDGNVFPEDVRRLIDERESAPDLRDFRLNESRANFIHRSSSGQTGTSDD